MKKDIEDHVRHCLPCQKAKFESQPGAGFSHLRFYLGPGQSIAIDIVVLNHASTMGTKYFFTILDCFSHWPEAIPMKDMEAETCAKALWQWIRNHGAPPMAGRSLVGTQQHPRSAASTRGPLLSLGSLESLGVPRPRVRPVSSNTVTCRPSLHLPPPSTGLRS